MGYHKNLIIEDWEKEAEKDSIWINEAMILAEQYWWEADIQAFELSGEKIDIERLKQSKNATLREMGENIRTGI